jgi:hypothetical protein
VQPRGIDEYGIAQVEDHIAGALADDAIQLRSELRSSEDVEFTIDVDHRGAGLLAL